MLRKVFCVLSVLVLVLILALPATAASFDDGSYPSTTYYAAIPFDTVFFDNGAVFSAGSNMSQFTIGQSVGSGQDASSLIVNADLVGYDYTSGDDGPTPDLFSYIFTQTRYSNASSYYSAYNRYQTSGCSSVTFTSGSFGLDYLQYSSLASYGGLVLPAGSQVQVSCSVSYYALNADSKAWELRSGSYSQSIFASAAGTYRIFPALTQLFGSDPGSLFPARMIPVESFVLHISFYGSVTDFSLAMLYGNQNSFASVLASSVDYLAEQKSTVEYETIYVSVFDEGGDLFEWLFDVIAGFFTTPIFGKFSLGGLLAVMIAIGIVTALIKFFS